MRPAPNRQGSAVGLATANLRRQAAFAWCGRATRRAAPPSPPHELFFTRQGDLLSTLPCHAVCGPMRGRAPEAGAEGDGMAGQPAAFMSYARFDDRHDDGQLTAFRDRLAAEVRVQTGEDFHIFQDRDDIAWGQNWQQRISQALDTVTLLLAIITPGFFRSPHCRAETEQFLDRERRLGRGDLILPVYYVSTPEIDDPSRRDADPLAAILATRQHADWRELRFEPTTSPAKAQWNGRPIWWTTRPSTAKDRSRRVTIARASISPRAVRIVIQPP